MVETKTFLVVRDQFIFNSILLNNSIGTRDSLSAYRIERNHSDNPLKLLTMHQTG